MRPEDVERLYDEGYAASYDSKFLESELAAPDTRHELELIRSLLPADLPWLDVACGTGFFLSHFPEVSRAGLDISPAMLDRARAANPGVEFRRHDFRRPIPEWTDRFGLVSCMWFAYGFVDTVAELDQVIANLAAWTAPEGRVFMPIAEPGGIAGGVDLLYRRVSPWSGEITITGVLWSYTEDGGTKVHRHQLAPTVEYLCERFADHFDQVDVIAYPPSPSGMSRGPALVAGGKRS